jgi:hypothetical protein
VGAAAFFCSVEEAVEAAGVDLVSEAAIVFFALGIVVFV